MEIRFYLELTKLDKDTSLNMLNIRTMFIRGLSATSTIFATANHLNNSMKLPCTKKSEDYLIYNTY